jgi:sec-independent protein translocase protein TatA
MFGLSVTELVIVLVIVFLIFGVTKLPQLGKGLGEGIKNFKSAIKEINKDPDEKPKEDKK